MPPLSSPQAALSRFSNRSSRLSWVLFVIFSVLCIVVLPDRSLNVFFPASHLDFSRAESVVDVPEGLIGNGLTNDVQWDMYSLIIKEQRVFIQ
ncbi:hypothetical protein BDR04DRAFT_334479 [Suillus decipiens]|nr:hypothetical protein BDR04DRAFT_334479 [Suillus decipiens]